MRGVHCRKEQVGRVHALPGDTAGDTRGRRQLERVSAACWLHGSDDTASRVQVHCSEQWWAACKAVRRRLALIKTCVLHLGGDCSSAYVFGLHSTCKFGHCMMLQAHVLHIVVHHLSEVECECWHMLHNQRCIQD